MKASELIRKQLDDSDKARNKLDERIRKDRDELAGLNREHQELYRQYNEALLAEGQDAQQNQDGDAPGVELKASRKG